MKTLLIVIAIIGMHCGIRKPAPMPKFIIHQTDSGQVFVYKNHPDSETIYFSKF